MDNDNNASSKSSSYDEGEIRKEVAGIFSRLSNLWVDKCKRTLLVDDNTIIDSLKRLYEYAYNMVDEKKKEYRESSDVE